MTNFFVASQSKLLNCFGFLILMFVFSIQSNAQTTVTGTVSDDKGPIPGANVNVKGTKTGVSTGFDGTYSIDVPSNGVLVFSFLGFTSREVGVNGQKKINVKLEEDSNNLKEVVVIGYGAQRKEAVTGSVASIKGSEIREVPSANITQSMQGRLPGVQITQTSTKPGAAMQIRIRGTRSLTAGNDPLVVLDGIPFSGTLADISPEDIKSVDILKDASATAIYGSRGANGVILVTSNRGSKGQRTSIAYSTYTGYKTAVKYPMMEGPKYVEFRKLAGKNLVNGIDEADDVNTDWQDLFYRTGIVTNHDIAVTGGTENGNYNVGVNYYKDQAVIPGSEYNRYSIRAALDQEIGIFKIGFSSNNNYSITDGASLGMYGVLSMSPIANPYNEDGSLKRTVKMPQDENWVYTRESMRNLGDKWADTNKAFGSYNSIYGELKIPAVDGLKARVNLGGNYRTSNSGTYTGIGVFNANPDNPNVASIGNSQSTSWTVETLLTYDRTFAEKHKINALAMYSSAQDTYNSSLISRRNIAGDSFQYFNLGQTSTGDNDDITINNGNQAYTQSGLISYMGRVMYSYADRYMISATVRSDASSRLAPSNQWHTYPAFSAGWNISKESFMKNVKWVNSLKLRGGYGQTSNQSVAPYATLGYLSTRPYNFGASNATGYYVSTLPNPNLGWEYSITTNVGLDFSLFNNRLSGTAEYYTTDTKDLLLSVNLPVTSGVSSYVGNVGSTENKGWELSLNGVILDNYNGWTWDAGVNIYSNKNKLVSLASGMTEDQNNWWFVGKPLNVIYDYKKVGIWQTDAEAKQYEGPAGQAGMIRVAYTGDYNANGTPTRLIGAQDRQVLNADPDFQGGFNTRVAYKNFDISLVGLFQSGGILNSTLYGSNGYLNINDGRRGQIDVDYWTPENTDAQFPKPGGPTESNNPKYGSTSGYFDGSFVKLKTITLGYSLNKQWIKSAGMEKLKLYCTIQNPWVIYSPYHKVSGLDPETNSYANDASNMAVAYSGNLSRLLTVGYNTPQSRNLILGLNIIF
ncbi:TonB-dependent receptor [Flavobacterium sp. LHD-85]|uniref:SusC/RagA family TonB-linked outer membrane protein n=1 Tax=Flavobacterium sp. LHD-85 TaxID=3071410 RepID=UPI0027DFFB13|nr:TonB-dependent receptor [Flavobacterium sp. LHD-85]MDQ6530939.1 TonB-dependent receptor [Flavobacterium sp. LHD-85]